MAAKESFHRFWFYRSPTWARAHLKEWTTRAMRSRIEEMKKIAKMLRKQRKFCSTTSTPSVNIPTPWSRE